MLQVRIHGRGGQGTVTTAELLAVAAFTEDKHAQAFPSFGSERMGAPVMSFCRIDDRPIRTREPVTDPDALIIGDPTLLHQADLFSGLTTNGYLLVNSARTFTELGLDELAERLCSSGGTTPPNRVVMMPASQLALTHLGRPLPGTALLGGFAALTGAISLDAVTTAIRARFSGKVAEGNIAAARAAFDFVEDERKALLSVAKESSDV